jgi:glycosyltransferase involved in cell wall biosynthesis
MLSKMCAINQFPKITIVTPSFNQGQFIEKTICSVLAQNYPNLEYIIMDGGSTDGTLEIINKYKDQISHFESHPDAGQADAIKRGFQISKGEILAYLNSDDVYFQNTFSEVAKAFSKKPKMEWAIGNSLEINEKDQVVQTPWVLTPDYYSILLWKAAAFSQAASFWRRKPYFEVGEIDSSFRYCMDYDLYVRLAKRSKPGKINHFLASVRIHKNQKTQTLGYVSDQEQAIIHSKYNRDRFGKLVIDLANIYYPKRASALTKFKAKFINLLGRFHLITPTEWKPWW